MLGEQRYVAVVGLDFSDLSDRALDQAIEVASLNGGEVHTVYVEPEQPIESVIQGSGPLDSATTDAAIEQVRRRTGERIKAVTDKRGQLALTRAVAHFRRGSPAVEIAQLAADIDADLVVVGSHGRRGVARVLLGSVAERVSRLARCQVWIIRPKDHAASERVPEIEPPCPDCLTTREATRGAKFWCARHSEHHLRPHRYSYVADGIYSAETQAYEFTPERGA
jgi:nucleotide-binding universal stress UspA family protein